MKRMQLASFLAVLLLASLACSLFGGGSAAGTESNPPAAGEAPAGESGGDAASSEFPLPSDYSDLKDVGGVTMFETSMGLDELVAFYRDAFAGAGYEEREITTVISDTAFSIVWDGHESGKAVVVQCVDLGNGVVNVSIRLEDM
jgi:hypothetical protein